MNKPCDPDQQFHENLSLLGRLAESLPEPSREVHAACLAAIDSASPAPYWRITKMMKKPAVLSLTGIAASILVLAVLLFPWNNTPTVEAATIMKCLNQQFEQDPCITVRLNNFTIDEVFINGTIHVADQGIAGDLQVEVQEGQPDQVLKVDLAMGLTESGGWVLLRELTIPDPEAQVFVQCIFPPGSETLLMLPAEEVHGEMMPEISSNLEELRSGELMEIIQELINSHEEYGATLQHQRDGTILLTLPFKDAEALTALAKLVPEAEGEINIEIGNENQVSQVELGDDNILIGSTLTVVYDPEAALVRSFALHNLGGNTGSVDIEIGEGELDPELFDSERVMTPATRVFDLGALETLIESFQ